MKTKLLLLMLIFSSIAFAQNDFNLISDDTLLISDKRPNEVKLSIKKESTYYKDGNTVEILIDNDISEIPKIAYNINSFKTGVKDNDGNFVAYLKFTSAFDINSTKKLFIKINVYDSTNKLLKTDSTLVLYINNINKLTSYSYLGYIGTNFDLVDGIKAKNLFFAANVFVTPKPKKIGFYLSLYGNRTVSISDSIMDVRRRKEVGMDSLNNSYSIYENSNVKRKIEADNLGAFISALIRLTKIDNEVQLYYSPSMEFIWRRNYASLDYVNTSLSDSIYNENGITRSDVGVYNLPHNRILSKNTFDFNIGIIGLFLNHENERISVRINMNTGVSLRNLPLDGGNSLMNETLFKTENDLFFTGRAWITEKLSGVTLQAEIYNAFNKTNPYYGVTLSKAFDLDKLGNFFSPITSRN